MPPYRLAKRPSAAMATVPARPSWQWPASCDDAGNGARAIACGSDGLLIIRHNPSREIRALISKLRMRNAPPTTLALMGSLPFWRQGHRVNGTDHSGCWWRPRRQGSRKLLLLVACQRRAMYSDMRPVRRPQRRAGVLELRRCLVIRLQADCEHGLSQPGRR